MDQSIEIKLFGSYFLDQIVGFKFLESKWWDQIVPIELFQSNISDQIVGIKFLGSNSLNLMILIEIIIWIKCCLIMNLDTL